MRREEFDRRAIQGALEVLQAGEIILVAPEAHRGPALQQAKEGIAYLATRSNAPVVPVAIDGTEGFPSCLSWPAGAGRVLRCDLADLFAFEAAVLDPIEKT